MQTARTTPAEWTCRYPERGAERLLRVQLSNGVVHVEDGPADDALRWHASSGGRQSFESFLERPAPWTRDFPEVAARVRAAILTEASGGTPE